MFKLLFVTFVRFFIHGFGLKLVGIFFALFFFRYLLKVWKRLVKS